MKRNERKLNVRLLRRIQARIRKDANSFWMDGVCMTARTKTQLEWDNIRRPWMESDLPRKMPSCGTAACIAGWTTILTTGKYAETDMDALNMAAIKLGIDFQYDYVFLVNYWPEPFRAKYKKSRSSTRRAMVACDRIDHLIKTGK